MLSTLLELAGIATLVAAAFLIAPIAGAIVFGAALLVVGIFLGSKR